MRKTVVLAERESSFVATVQEGTPYRWTALDFSLQLIGSLRLSQITYFPPTSLEDLRRYNASAGTSTASSSSSPVHSVRAILRTLTANNKVEDFVLACFPLEESRLADAALFTIPPVARQSEVGGEGAPRQIGASGATAVTTKDPLKSGAGPSPLQPAVSSLLPQRRDACDNLTDTFVLPCVTDIAAGLNVHVGLDGFTELRVEGPGTVVFTGEEKIGVLSPSRREHSFQ
jgi:hypothetical protein